MQVERVDFISLPTEDRERARVFYLETLGLPLDRDTPVGFEVKWASSTGPQLEDCGGIVSFNVPKKLPVLPSCW